MAVYKCAKCKFLFERKNEPSKCPSCENQCVMDANRNERQEYKETYQRDTENQPSFNDSQ